MAKPQVRWQYFPKSEPCPGLLNQVVKVFEANFDRMNSFNNPGQSSNDALAIVRSGLEAIGFQVEKDKTAEGKIRVPVHYGENGKVTQAFEADAFNPISGVVLEVEAGRAVVNYQFLKDLFQASVMQGVDYAAIAVRQDYQGMKDFEKVISFMDTLYSSNRLALPLKGVIILGY